MRAGLALLCLALLLRAEEPRPPRLLARTPDDAARASIEAAAKRLISGTSAERARARAELAGYGPWSVPLLRDLVGGKRSDPRARTGAALALGAIPLPEAADALRGGGDESDSDPYLRAIRAFALGAIGGGGPEWTRRGLLFLEGLQGRRPDAKQKPRDAALCLFAIARYCGAGEEGKSRAPNGAESLLALASREKEEPVVTAAALLAATIAHPRAQAKAIDRLGSPDDLVRATAALCLVLRPPAQPDEILRRLKQEGKGSVRARMVMALGAVPRDDRLRKELLSIATDESEKKEARVAALLALAAETGEASIVKPLRKSLRNQNDPVVGATLYAIGRAGGADAWKELLARLKTGSDPVRCFAAGTLLDALAEGRVGEESRAEVAAALAGIQTQDPTLRQLAEAARAGTPGAMRAALRKVQDPKGLSLWRVEAKARVWDETQRQILQILALDDIADFGQGQDAPDPVMGGGGGEEKGKGGGKRTPDHDEADLLEFLRLRNYFDPGDLVRG